MRIIHLFAFLALAFSAEAQYWLGPKVGYHYTLHDYQDEAYEGMYAISKDHNYEIGMALTYTASERYSVHTELYYERIGNRVQNKEGDFFVDSKSTNAYLSTPLLLRVSMGHSPVHWYVNGGPKLSLWLGGKGEFANGIFDEFEAGKLNNQGYFEYKMAFDRSKAEGINNGVYYINEANRIQYSLTVGGGFYLDLANGARLMFDARYNWGHSNMGFNVDPQAPGQATMLVGNSTNIPSGGYQENYEFSNNTMSFSIGYMFEYNTELKRKGSSTNSDAQRTKKATQKKKKN
jgi:hypothetical protein